MYLYVIALSEKISNEKIINCEDSFKAKSSELKAYYIVNILKNL